MENDYTTIEIVDCHCPICGEFHKIEKRKRITQNIIKEKLVTYEEEYFFCPNASDDENEFVTGEMLDKNFERARNEYKRMIGE